ncbi:hypothetical protein Q3G72_010836 [Acer saccharum]|nr:hypothetical protein Q3G72_010836 [Acer saccharum]
MEPEDTLYEGSISRDQNQARREAMAARKAGTPRAAPVLSIGDGAIPPTSSAAFAAPKVMKARRTMM